MGQQTDLLSFTVDFTRSLFADIQRLLIHPTRGATYSLARRYAILVRDFGTLTAGDFKTIQDRFTTPYRPGRLMREHIAAITRAHSTLATNGIPMNDHDKVQTFIRTIQPCALFTTAIHAWLERYPSVVTQRFTTLTTAIQLAFDNLDTRTTSGYGYYANDDDEHDHVPPPLSGTDIDERIAAGIAAAVTKLIGKDKVLTRWTQPTKATRFALTPEEQAARAALTDEERALLYCWTHGPHSQKGNNFKSSAPGHKPNATIHKKRGGETTPPRERRANRN